MALEFWFKAVTPRSEVRQGRSFNPDEFAIALEQVVAGKAPADYGDPNCFFARTCFTRALREHAAMVLRRLAGETANTSPVLTLVTQFGGGKTHTLTALYHLVTHAENALDYPGVAAVLAEARLPAVPAAKVAVFVGNAWDPQPGRERPWIDIARQLAGDEGVKALGPAAQDSPPGTETISRVVELAGRPVLLLFDEVLNALTRHRWLAEPFHAFLHNLMRGFVHTTHRAAVVSLPRSPVEMTDWDIQWQEKLTKVVGAVAKQLIVNDEAEISEVVRRRLFEHLGDERTRRRVAAAYADWCFERRAQLPPEWTAVDTAATEAGARDFLERRFEACYPFHPATLSVFQRKWQALPQYQQTRGTLAMLAQWVSWTYREAFTGDRPRPEPLITLGSAPLHVPDFRSVVLGQLGEARLAAAIEADIAGAMAHARALDAETEGALRHIHRRVGTAILFESSGGQVDKVAHLPELRFALGEPDIDTTSVDSAALALESKAFFIRKIGSDGFQVRYAPTLKKVVSDRLASLDLETDVRPQMRALVRAEFERGRTIPIVFFPSDGADIPDSPRLNLIVVGPESEWVSIGTQRQPIADWTRQRGGSPRLYPGALVWCFKKPGSELRSKVESWLAWKRVKGEIQDGTLGGDFDRAEIAKVQAAVDDATGEAKDEVWASYRYVVLADAQQPDGLQVIDLGAGHSSASESLCGRVIGALKSQALLNESVSAGYLERNWPPALAAAGAWPLASLRKSFLDGSLTRLLDPDAILRAKLVDFIARGDFGLASGQHADGTYDRIWYKEPIAPDEVAFESGVYLLKKDTATRLVAPPPPGIPVPPPPPPPPEPPQPDQTPPEPSSPLSGSRTIRISGTPPPEAWNRLGTKIIPKLRTSSNVVVTVEFRAEVAAGQAPALISDLESALEDLALTDRMTIVQSATPASEPSSG